MKQQIKWQADRISLTFVYGDSFPISSAHVEVKSGKEAERSLSVALPHAIPLVEMMASGRGTGHWITNTRSVQTTLDQSLRYISCKCLEESDGSHVIWT